MRKSKLQCCIYLFFSWKCRHFSWFCVLNIIVLLVIFIIIIIAGGIHLKKERKIFFDWSIIQNFRKLTTLFVFICYQLLQFQQTFANPWNISHLRQIFGMKKIFILHSDPLNDIEKYFGSNFTGNLNKKKSYQMLIKFL